MRARSLGFGEGGEALVGVFDEGLDAGGLVVEDGCEAAGEFFAVGHDVLEACFGGRGVGEQRVCARLCRRGPGPRRAGGATSTCRR
ncbi:MAG: hypothetical protein HND58_13060 [Planctomycetota bacterium]|nr:MAG: hypothetical protein HND58_13060 [Planctomycetota bacterium]